MTEDIGQSLVGAYLRYVEQCDFVVQNTFLDHGQGELDVIGMKLGAEPDIIFCEVTTHILGIHYGNYDATVQKVTDKIRRAREFAEVMFEDERPRYEIWSPIVPVGKLTTRFDELAKSFSDDGMEVTFVIDEVYAERVQQLIDHARNNTRATADPAYRLLQILTRLKGGVAL